MQKKRRLLSPIFFTVRNLAWYTQQSCIKFSRSLVPFFLIYHLKRCILITKEDMSNFISLLEIMYSVSSKGVHVTPVKRISAFVTKNFMIQWNKHIEFPGRTRAFLRHKEYLNNFLRLPHAVYHYWPHLNSQVKTQQSPKLWHRWKEPPQTQEVSEVSISIWTLYRGPCLVGQTKNNDCSRKGWHPISKFVSSLCVFYKEIF